MNINNIQKKADLFHKLSTRQKLHYDPSSVNPELNPVVSDELFDVPNEPRHLEPKRKLLIHLPESIIPIIDEIIKIDEHISNAREKKSLMTDPEKKKCLYNI